LHAYAKTTYPNGFQFDNPHGIENSCTVANALQEMLCMSVNDKIRLFPVWPTGYDAQFDRIRARGAFLVSSSLKRGEVSNVQIFSEKGRVCTIVNPWGNKPAFLIRKGRADQKLTGQELSFTTRVNETIQLVSALKNHKPQYKL
jgi:alpha-L-fucosidase 2